MTDEKQPTGDFEVGYGKPPAHTRFQKGQPGNPKGRPKGTKNLKTDLLEELSELMIVREDGRQRRISKQRALVKTQAARALKGNDRAAAKILDLYQRVAGLENDAADVDLPLTEDERAVIENLEEKLRRRVDAAARKADDDNSHGGDDNGTMP